MPFDIFLTTAVHIVFKLFTSNNKLQKEIKMLAEGIEFVYVESETIIVYIQISDNPNELINLGCANFREMLWMVMACLLSFRINHESESEELNKGHQSPTWLFFMWDT